MHTFRQPPRLRSQHNWILLPGAVLTLFNLWDLRSWQYGLLSVPMVLQGAALCLLAGIVVVGAVDQRRRQVVVAPDGLHTRRVGRSKFVPWDAVRDVQVCRTWLGDYLVVATPKRMVRLDVPYLLVPTGAARREFEAVAGEVQRVIAEHGVFAQGSGER